MAMGPRHTHEQILVGAVTVARSVGLSRLTFGGVAAHVGTSDRMVVYYFPTKDELVLAVLARMGLDLQQVLGRALVEPATDHLGLLRLLWPVVTEPEVEPTFRLLFEAIGLAVAGRSPFDIMATGLTEAWIEWLGTHLAGHAQRRRTEAEAAVALLDGLMLLRMLAGPDAAGRAAARLGVV